MQKKTITKTVLGRVFTSHSYSNETCYQEYGQNNYNSHLLVLQGQQKQKNAKNLGKCHNAKY